MPSFMRNVNTLVTVAGHATFLGSLERVPDDPSDERHWELQHFQAGEVPIYITHMRYAADLVAADSSSLGIMSGGRTRPAGGLWSEAESYLGTALRFGFWQGGDETSAADVCSRFDTERHARDSLENVWFSVMHYRRMLGRMPLNIAMVGWEVKEPRFEYHARTLGIPQDVYSYEAVPLDAYGNTVRPQDMGYFVKSEIKNLGLWQETPLGDSGLLLDKRNDRNPFGVTPPYSWAEYVGYAQEAGWQPSQEILAAAAIEGTYVA